MKLEVSEGLWTTGPLGVDPPLSAVLELDGAVLSWVVDDPAAAPELAFTDTHSADWLFRLVGDRGHVAVLDAVADPMVTTVDVVGVDTIPGALEPLRRLAVGHWLRRWWPAGARDGVATLDGALLDAEVALLTVQAQEFLSAELADAEITDLLAPLADSLAVHLQQGDPRVVALVNDVVDVAAEVGVDGPGWDAVYAARDQAAAPEHASVTQDDFALAAGQSGNRGAAPIASGTASVKWAAVPPGTFDAAENTVVWNIVAEPSDRGDQSGGNAIAVVQVAVVDGGSPAGIRVVLQAGSVTGSGVLDRGGTAALTLSSEGTSVSETAAWGHDWSSTVVTVGADVEESANTRQRVRAYARNRLAAPGNDAFLAEILAAESDY